MGVGQREKEGKEARKRESSQDEPALEKGERQLKSAKIEIILCRDEKYRFWKRGEKEKKKRREREERDKSGDRTYGGSASPAHPPRCEKPTLLTMHKDDKNTNAKNVSGSDHSAAASKKRLRDEL